MKITLKSKNQEMELDYEEFKSLRIKIAEITGKEIGEHYKAMDKPSNKYLFGPDRTKFIEDYNKKIIDLEKEHNIPSGVLNFLYMSNIKGKLSKNECKEIYETIKPCKSVVAIFKKFKEIIKDCVDNECDLTWK